MAEFDPEVFRKAMEQVGDAVQRLTLVACAQGAMGWLMRSDLEQARATLLRLQTTEQLREVSAAAAALSSLADEVAAEVES
ncbi:hypothetical protein [Nocardia wallacei]|uniref:hypothetical protein n=1 Tax=Nocardia wallacei TaxID=480035 RepID=UPI0024547DC5|nr:hypothetical protein [Nocardia wallacei]